MIAPPPLLPGLIAESDLPAAIPRLSFEHALVYDGAKTLVWSLVPDRVLGRSHWKQSSLSDFRAWYAAFLVQDAKKWKSIADVWLCHEDARRYRDVAFDPTNQLGPECLN